MSQKCFLKVTDYRMLSVQPHLGVGEASDSGHHPNTHHGHDPDRLDLSNSREGLQNITEREESDIHTSCLDTHLGNGGTSETLQNSNTIPTQSLSLTVNIQPSSLVNGNSSSHSGNSTYTTLQQIKDQLTVVYDYHNLEECVLKFRNARGSHVPLNATTISNSGRSRNPLYVEICPRYFSTKHSVCGNSLLSESAITPMCLQREQERASTARSVCSRLEQRLTNLEQSLLDRPVRRSLFLEVCDLTFFLHMGFRCYGLTRFGYA